MSEPMGDRVRRARPLLALWLLWAVFPTAAADERPLAIAVLDFEADRKELVPAAKEMTDLLIAGLASSPHLILVERQRLSELLSEMELGISGTVSPGTAARLGRLIGAKALITGRVFSSGDDLVAVVRAIGTETGQVYAESSRLAAHGPAAGLRRCSLKSCPRA